MLLYPGDPFEVVGVFAAIGTTLLMLYAGFIAVRWVHRKLEAPKLPEGQELDELRERVARLEECELRLAEMEERLDFAERMLAQAQPQGVLPRAKEG
ncbi:MAG TPA: hypothetical protein VG940_08470 [Gemmatimonadales bacterium]|nr:hypothetical protein [Gemmatimonadales bacterium]